MEATDKGLLDSELIDTLGSLDLSDHPKAVDPLVSFLEAAGLSVKQINSLPVVQEHVRKITRST